MANHILAVHLGAENVELAVAQSTLRSLRIQLLASLDIESDAVRQIVGGRAWDRVVATLPADSAVFRLLDFPFRDRRRLAQAVGPALEAHVPISLDEAVVAWDFTAANHRGPILAAMAPREALDRHRAALSAIGLEPDILVWQPSAVLDVYRRAAGANATFTAVDVGLESTIVATFEDGRLTGMRAAGRSDDEATVRNIGWFARTLEPASARAIVGGARADVLLPALAEVAPGLRLETLPERCPVEIADPAAPAWRGSPTVVGLALAAGGDLAQPVLDFASNHALHRDTGELRAAAVRIVPWAVATIVLLLLAGTLDYTRQSSRAAELESRARALFESVMPAAASGPGYRLKMELRAQELARRAADLTGAGPRTTPLAVLAGMSTLIPAELAVEFEHYAYDPPHVRLRGRGASFETVTRLQETLRQSKAFASVEVNDVHTAVAGDGVQFELTLKLGGAGEPA